MRPLAESDLESFLEIGWQLLNISKPFVIEGIGSLVMDAHRQVSFVQGEAVVHGDEHLPKRKQSGEKPDTEIHFDDNYLRPSRTSAPWSQRFAIVALVMLGIVLIGWVARYFGNLQDGENPRQQEVSVHEPVLENREPALPDAQTLSQPAPDSTVAPVPTATTTVQEPAKTEAGFDIVLEVSKRTRAMKRYADLQEWGHKVRMHTSDSVTFKLSIPIDAPLADSIRHRDSLSRFFGRKVWISALVPAALFFSWLGDVLLMLEGRNGMFFILGLLGFLTAHALYIAYFIRIPATNGRSFIRKRPVMLLAVLAYVVELLYVLWPSLDGMKIPVLIYGIVIGTMLCFALWQYGKTDARAAGLMIVGAILFVASDSLLAINKFKSPIPFGGIWVMSTYILAQYCIVKGSARQILQDRASA